MNIDPCLVGFYKNIIKERFREVNMATSIGDFETCRLAANQFVNVANFCYKDKNPGEYMLDTFYPYAVNASLACELYIKAIMIYRSTNNEFETGHDLRELYDKLPTHDAQALSQEFSKLYSFSTLEQFLDENGQVFVRWRYAFENTVAINISGFECLLSVLNDYVSKL